MSTQTLYIDLDAVSQLSAQLQGIYQALESAKSDFNSFAASLGSSDVSGALNSFQSGWKDGRTTIENEIANLMDAIKGAAQDYQHSEDELAKASSSAGVKTTLSHAQ